MSDITHKLISLEDINKQAYIVLTNINGVKITTNICDENHQTLIDSFCNLQGLFNSYIKQGNQPLKYTHMSESFEYLNTRFENLKREKDYLHKMEKEGWVLVSVVHTAPSKVYNHIVYYWKKYCNGINHNLSL